MTLVTNPISLIGSPIFQNIRANDEQNGGLFYLLGFNLIDLEGSIYQDIFSESLGAIFYLDERSSLTIT